MKRCEQLEEISAEEKTEFLRGLLIDNCNPVEIILFGSHARGSSNGESDIDLFVVVDDAVDLDRLRNWIHECPEFSGADVIFRHMSDYCQKARQFGMIDYVVAIEGKSLYRR